MIQHLLWKDWRIIQPLAKTIVAGYVVINVLALLYCLAEDRTFDWAWVVWLAHPVLMAWGAPAMLVGSEEESGTLQWVRTLPVSWRHVVGSKFFVAFVAVTVTWLASVVMVGLVLGLPLPENGPRSVPSLISDKPLLSTLFFSYLMLIVGFCWAYLLRSPVTALLFALPSAALLHGLTEQSRMRLVQMLSAELAPHSSFDVSLVASASGALVVLGFGWLFQRYLGRWRLTSTTASAAPARDLRQRVSTALHGYRPTPQVGTRRPKSAAVAMLWQQHRQSGKSYLGLTVLLGAGILLFSYETNAFKSNGIPTPGFQVAQVFCPVFVGLGACWLGSLCFYADHRSGRTFFADRGISPTAVWWTRLLGPGLCVLSLVALAITVHALRVTGVTDRFRADFWIPCLVSGLLVVGFGFGQLTGQWMTRPIIAFLAAPAFGVLCCFYPLIVVTSVYPTYGWAMLWVGPVLLAATWRLTPAWLTGAIDGRFHFRVLVYSAWAILLPGAAVLAIRYASMPVTIPEWRQRMLAIDDPGINDSSSFEMQDWHSNLSLNVVRGGGSVVAPDANPLAAVQRELAGDSPLATHVSYDDLARFLRQTPSPDNQELQRASVAVMLRWSTTIREDVAAGRRVAETLKRVARPLEYTALEWMGEQHALPHHPREALGKLASGFPSLELRNRSRRIGLINEWRRYQRRGWSDSHWLLWRYQSFMNQQTADGINFIPLERMRADRFIDLATQRLLEQVEHGLPEEDSAAFRETSRLWREAHRPPSYPGDIRSQIPWHNRLDREIAELQGKHREVTGEIGSP